VNKPSEKLENKKNASKTLRNAQLQSFISIKTVHYTKVVETFARYSWNDVTKSIVMMHSPFHFVRKRGVGALSEVRNFIPVISRKSTISLLKNLQLKSYIK